MQDKITQSIVSELSLTLGDQELEAITLVETTNTEAYEAYLNGLSFYHRNTPTDNAKAEPHFKRAVELDPDFKRAYAALAKVYLKGADHEYSFALGIYHTKAIYLAYQNLEKSVGAKIAGAHVIRSRLALNIHQLDVALQEAEQALQINTNDVDALKAKARALIYSGRYEEGRKLASRARLLDPVFIAEPLYIIGLSHFASGSYDKAAEYVQRAVEKDPETIAYDLLLTAVYGKLGMKKEAKEALARYRKIWRWSFWVAAAVYSYPFEDSETLKHLADGFKAAGLADRAPLSYMHFDRETRLTGQEIKALLFGRTIRGQGFWSGLAWEQKRTIDGKLSHSGQSNHTGLNDVTEEGKSWVEDDRLCDRWFEDKDEITICVLVFRDSSRGQNNYYMVTNQGPNPFRVLD